MRHKGYPDEFFKGKVPEDIMQLFARECPYDHEDAEKKWRKELNK
jgi:hypothetical protein